MNTEHAIRPLHAALPEPVQSAIGAHRIVLVVSPITDVGLITRWLAQQGQEYCRLELSMGSPTSRAQFEQLRHATRWTCLPQIFIDGEFIGGTEQFFHVVGSSAPTALTGTVHTTRARWLGYAGLIPFFSLALLSLTAPASLAQWATQALMAYGAVILSFVGALHWARGLDSSDAATSAGLLTVSVMPALVAWLALLLPVAFGLVLLAAGFALLYAYDRNAWRWRSWFLSMRSHLTAGAVGSLMIVWLGAA